MQPPPDFGKDTYNGTGKLTGKVALITGGDSGIGRAVALAFAREGANIAISYLNEEVDALEIKKWVEAAGRTCLLFPGDIAIEANIRNAVQGTVKQFGKIDILVNNAAHQSRGFQEITELTRERLEYTYQVNVLAAFDFVRYAIPSMPSGSSIIITASVQAYDPSWSILDYATTKGALITFTKGLAQYAVSKGIRVNAVAPGPVWTPLIVSALEGQWVSNFGSDNDMGRPAQPAELAPAYVYLASADSSFTNGEILGVSGGILTG